ncbi:MAG: Fic family protein [Planctomycetota bacterium]|nr:Fic family protein [Planctomycetota bacterium]
MRRSDFQGLVPGRITTTEFEDRGRRIAIEAFVPSPLPPALDRVSFLGRLYDSLEYAERSLQRLDGVIDALPGRTVLLGALRVREAQTSSRIENTFATVREIVGASADAPNTRPEALEVLRARLAIERALRSDLPISGRLLRDMHRVLVIDASKRPGEFRDVQVCIGDEHRGIEYARFVPPPAAEVEACMRDWELFANPGSLNAPGRERWPDLVELAFAHYQFETIHPFSDGNGRLGRAIVTLTPVKQGWLKHPVCTVSEWVSEHRAEYYDALLRVSTHADWEGWVRFFCTAVAEQAKADMARATRLSALYERYSNLILGKPGSVRLIRLLDHLFDRHALTIPDVASLLGITYPPAKKHVEKLMTMGILRLLFEANYGKVYIAEEVVRAIHGADESEPDAPPA